jgi:NADPH:quinone reductase-like Zn-dependent oxidoreductase
MVMRKVVVHRAGGHERLVIENNPVPTPGPGEVLVENAAIGVNFADIVVRMGLYDSAKEYVGWPITPGFECAGKIARTGSSVAGHGVGDEVVALTRFGAYATHVVVPEGFVFRKPAALTLVEASAFYVAHLTAWYALRELSRVRPGQRVLVHSAAGGVGSALVTIAKRERAFVVGVVGAAHKVEAVRALGADVVIDKSREDLWAAVHRHAPAGYHVVLDANGVETLRGSYQHLAPTGRLVVYGFHSMLRRGKDRPSWGKLAADFLRTPRFNPIDMTNANKSVMAFNLSYLFEEKELLAECMADFDRGLSDGTIRPPAVTTFPFDRVADAHAALESGKSVGRIALVV